MTKAVEIFFRHKVRLLVLLLLPVLISGVIVMLLPRQYQANANLYAFQRYGVISATGVESDLQSTEAMTQADALSGLLQTRSFCLAVADDTDLPKQLDKGADVQSLQDALYTEISTHVQVLATTSHIFQITYTNTNPVIAMQVVRAVIAHYGKQSTDFATVEAQNLLATYRTQLTTAQDAANQAAKATTDYLQAHGLTAAQAQTDPKYLQLAAAASQTNAAVADIQTHIQSVQSQLAQLGSGAGSLYGVVDAPTVPSKPESRTKELLLGGGVGLAIGLVLMISYFLILTRLDQSLYSVAEVPAVTSYPVLVQIPKLPRRSAAWISQSNGNYLPAEGN